MGKISLYLLCLILYLGVYKSFIGHTHGNIYLENTYNISKFIPYSKYSVILNEASSRGYFIKSYYLTFKIFLPYEKSIQTLRFEVDKDYFYEQKDKIGLSIFRRLSLKEIQNIASIPGILYINDNTFGKWITNRSGNKEWHFHTTYKNLYKLFNWKSYRPTKKEYENYLYFISRKININKQKISFLKSNKKHSSNYFGLNIENYFSKLSKKIFKTESKWINKNELNF